MPQSNQNKRKGRKHYPSKSNKENKKKIDRRHYKKKRTNKPKPTPNTTNAKPEITPNTMTDPRFKKVFTDPRFQTLPEKRKDPNKVEVDSRFASMFTDPAFRTGYRIDRYGRQVNNNEAYDLHKFYHLEENNENPTQNEGYEAEHEEEDETPKLSKRMQKQVDKFKASEKAEIEEDDAFWDEWDNRKEEDGKPLTHKEEKLLNRRAGHMFDYAQDSSTSSSDASDYNYNTLKPDEVGDDSRAILDDNDPSSECMATRRLAA
eukprot:240105_1